MKKLIPIVAIIILLLIIRNITVSILSSSKEGGIREKLERQIAEEKKRQIYLKEQLYHVESRDFIENEAKEKLGYLLPGEYFVIAPTETPINNKPVEIDARPNWKKWWELFF